MVCDPRRGIILVVDNDLEIRGLAKRFLEKAGYSVVTAADGEEGLRFYREHRSSIVLLLTDVMMPKINGFALADRLLGMESQLPVLFMSAEAWGTYRGLNCIAKPFGSAELVEMAGQALNASTHSRNEVAVHTVSTPAR
jgi:two-component system, cell cycle sensor histidine kinase and response regulator CckA